MPKPLSPEQVEALQTSGALAPLEAVASSLERPEPGAVFRALGNTGLPHMDMVGRMDGGDEDTPSITPEVPGSGSFAESILRTREATAELLQLVGEAPPNMVNIDPTEAGATFDLYERLGLEPSVVITPANRSLAFWKELFQATQASSLNPNQGSQKLLRNSGLYIADNVRDAWTTLTVDPDHDFRLEVIAGSNRPHVTNVTPYGYQDSENKVPHPGLNKLLGDLNLPEVPDRSTRKVRNTTALTQPACLPKVDTYAMFQLSRIASGQDPIDTNTWSWLYGQLDGGDLPDGRWRPDGGRVSLSWGSPGGLLGLAGVRPSGRGRP